MQGSVPRALAQGAREVVEALGARFWRWRPCAADLWGALVPLARRPLGPSLLVEAWGLWALARAWALAVAVA